jgi:dephospho-CoA kinase
MKNHKLYIIGVTGNICSGKSAAASFLGSQTHSKFLNLDEFGHIIYQKNFLLLNSLGRIFGNTIFKNPSTIHSTLQRKELGKIVFSNHDLMQVLNSLVLPEIHGLLKIYIDRMKRDINEPTVLYIEGAIIGENKNFYYPFDEVWLITASKEEIERRFKERLIKQNIGEYDPKTLEFILKRQMDMREKMKICNQVIDTSQDFEITKQKYLELHNKVLRDNLL